MIKNVPKVEKLVRVGLGILFGFMALLAGGWPGWARIGSGIVALAFLGTALVGY
ncbi:MAG: YgaP-like transmembrane domain [Pseudomonadota bacterium]